MSFKTYDEAEEIIYKIKGITNQLGLLYEVGTEGGNTLDNYTMCIWLMESNLRNYCNQLEALVETERCRKD